MEQEIFQTEKETYRINLRLMGLCVGDKAMIKETNSQMFISA